MPYASHLRVTMAGDLSSGTGPVLEQFSYRLNLSNPTAALASDSNRFSGDGAADVAADAVAFHGRVGSRIGSMARLTEVKMASIGPDGKYTADPFIVAVDQRGGGPNQITHAPQVSLAVSLTTERRGSSGRGRFYLPVPSTLIGTNLIIDPIERDQVQASVAQFLQDLNNWPLTDSGDPRVVIASTKGFNSNVTGVRVGLVLDTIRSRRNNIVEGYGATTAVG
jgi:hypothetical protein